MKIIAMWDRPAAHERYGQIFILCEDSRFLAVSHKTIFDGRDKHGMPRYIETGFPEYSSAFPDPDGFDFKKAALLISHYGGVLVKRFD